jgi:hypothetical protein
VGLIAELRRALKKPSEHERLAERLRHEAAALHCRLKDQWAEAAVAWHHEPARGRVMSVAVYDAGGAPYIGARLMFPRIWEAQVFPIAEIRALGFQI